MIRILYQGGVVLFFLSMMLLLFQWEVIPRYKYGTAIPIQAKELTTEWVDIDETMTVYFNNFPIGIIKQSVKKGTPNNVPEGFEGRTVFLLRGGFVNADLYLQTFMNRDLEMTNFTISFKNKGEQVMDVYGRMTPDRFLNLRLDTPTGKKYRRIKLNSRPTFNLASTNILESLQLNPNEDLQLNIYDPILGLNSESARFRLGELQEIELEGRKIFTSVVEMQVSSLSTTMFFDPLNQVIRREINFTPPQSETTSAQALPTFTLRMDRTSTNPMIEQIDALIADNQNFLVVDGRTFSGEDEGEVPGLLNLPTLLMQQSFGK
ncbi:MAG: hypothetical protein ACFCU1_12595 [Sumerlaeia bacterium]